MSVGNHYLCWILETGKSGEVPNHSLKSSTIEKLVYNL